jgi:hypothetical protein
MCWRSFWQNAKSLSSLTHHTSLNWHHVTISKNEIETEGRRFDITEEIQAKLQRALDTLTAKDLQEAFQKWRSWWDQCLHMGGNYFEGDGHQEALW